MQALFLIMLIALVGWIIHSVAKKPLLKERTSQQREAITNTNLATARVEEHGQQHSQHAVDSLRETADTDFVAAQAEMVNRVGALLVQHRTALVRKYRQLVRKDDYGNTIDDDWLRERDYFVEKVILKYGSGVDLATLDIEWLREYVDSYASGEAASSFEDGQLQVDDISPIEFEHLCADVLAQSGWQAQVTSPSGDQGIDILATKNATVVVIQCKKHSRPVGNGAVQEVFAGKAFSGATHAAVVATCGFTPQARQLASQCDVHLLDISDLYELDSILHVASAS